MEGTGKTHSIVNVAATTLSRGESVLVTSPNVRALNAFWEALPDKLRPLALDLSCCVEGCEITKVQQALEALIVKLCNIEPEQDKIDKLTRLIREKKKKLKAILDEDLLKSRTKRSLLDNGFDNLLVSIIELSDQALWLVNAILSNNAEFNVKSVKDGLSGVEEFRKGTEAISFEVGDLSVLI